MGQMFYARYKEHVQMIRNSYLNTGHTCGSVADSNTHYQSVQLSKQVQEEEPIV
jgi:hypothetical protein